MLVRTLATFVVRLFNLVEAEAASAKKHVIRLGLSLALVWAAVVIFVSAAGVLVAAVAVALAEVLHLGWAMAIVGLILLFVAGGCGLAAWFVFGRKGKSS